ncbi:PREDICTED: DNA mismatch repair protein Mlh1 [Acromyrmex echinatior]|uniref:DNA mismatch repair protein Mlh1 n=1 Tax=Acromyrmex echinatior TaxID=103372 RepID=F4WUV0_ACREC|nr:PREDICTED: DNA mismatch repair protein Mlh1 [Acromyrmex echinatior]EGI62014.1 DNA mismatch repair protein Mlh1 [Acromyrmex echinatior]
MCTPAKIRKLDEVVVNRIAAGEIIQRPANALKELIENSLDAKATNIQITAKEGGLKLLQIQDNGTGIRKEDMEIVCERFTTSKLQKFEDLGALTTFGFRGEALASISHIALLTITTKTADEKCAYKASYINSKLKAPPVPCAGNQGTVITIENLFYNVATRRKALSNPSEEFTKITEVVMRYAVHNSAIGFTLKKHGEPSSQVRTPYNSTKQNNIRILYGNPVARELLEVELDDKDYKFKMHGLVTNPNYTNKRMVMLLFINNRLVDSASIRKMLEDVYSVYLPKKAHPWCYISLDINPQNIDVNVHPTKHEVRFLHEDAIIERIKFALDERLTGNSASRTFYLQARLPKADITKEVLEEVLPEYNKGNSDKLKKIHAREMIRTDSSDQKLDKFNFTIHFEQRKSDNNTLTKELTHNDPKPLNSESLEESVPNVIMKNPCADNKCQEKNSNLNIAEHNCTLSTEKILTDNNLTRDLDWSGILDTKSSLDSQNTCNPHNSAQQDKLEKVCPENLTFDISEFLRDSDEEIDDPKDKPVDAIADRARKQVYQYFGNRDIIENAKKNSEKEKEQTLNIDNNQKEGESSICNVSQSERSAETNTSADESSKFTQQFKSYSVNNFKHEVKLTSILKLRKDVEDECHEGLRDILANLTFVGCIDQTSALIQSGVNLYICNTRKLTEELFYEIMLYDFANFGIIKFSERISLFDLAMIALDSGETGWTEEDGPKEELAARVKELLLEKADMMNEYFSIVMDKVGNLRSLPVLLDKYFPYEAEIPLYIMRLATEVDWRKEQLCFQNICRETAKFYSYISPKHQTHDWKYVTEHVLYPAIKESLLPPKHFAHDSTILQIASLPDLYKVFERC